MSTINRLFHQSFSLRRIHVTCIKVSKTLTACFCLKALHEASAAKPRSSRRILQINTKEASELTRAFCSLIPWATRFAKYLHVKLVQRYRIVTKKTQVTKCCLSVWTQWILLVIPLKLCYSFSEFDLLISIISIVRCGFTKTKIFSL